MVENLIASLKFRFGLEQCNGNVANMRTSSDQSVNHSLTAKKKKIIIIINN
jgi:hypothetical protein